MIIRKLSYKGLNYKYESIVRFYMIEIRETRRHNQQTKKDDTYIGSILNIHTV